MSEEMIQRGHLGPAKEYPQRKPAEVAREPIKRTVNKVTERTAQKGPTPRRI
jgi:hypothetical protein